MIGWVLRRKRNVRRPHGTAQAGGKGEKQREEKGRMKAGRSTRLYPQVRVVKRERRMVPRTMSMRQTKEKGIDDVDLEMFFEGLSTLIPRLTTALTTNFYLSFASFTCSLSDRYHERGQELAENQSLFSFNHCSSSRYYITPPSTLHAKRTRGPRSIAYSAVCTSTARHVHGSPEHTSDLPPPPPLLPA